MELDSLSDYSVSSAGSKVSRAKLLLSRKKHAKLVFDNKVHVSLFDDDSYEEKSIWNSLAKLIDKDDFLGTATIDLEDLRESGVRQYNLRLQGKAGSFESTTTLRLAGEYISFESISSTTVALLVAMSVCMFNRGLQRTRNRETKQPVVYED